MSVSTAIDLEALFDQLASHDGKAEIVEGEIVPMSPTGPWPGYAGDMIFISLRQFSQQARDGFSPVPSPLEGERARVRGFDVRQRQPPHPNPLPRGGGEGTGKVGIAVSDNKIFRVRNSPHRQSFSPDAAYHIGTKEAMRYYEGAPVFAVEVRSSGDYGPKAEEEMAAKRAEYFAAGTLVVWDVDLLSSDVVKVFRATSPERPTIYGPDDIAEAEPAAPGWTMPVQDLLPDEWQPHDPPTIND